MPLFNCKVELKLIEVNLCTLSVSGADNADANSTIIIFTVTKQKFISLLSLFQQKTIENYQIFLEKDLKDQWIRTNIKQNLRIKTQQSNIDIS